MLSTTAAAGPSSLGANYITKTVFNQVLPTVEHHHPLIPEYFLPPLVSSIPTTHLANYTNKNKKNTGKRNEAISFEITIHMLS